MKIGLFLLVSNATILVICQAPFNLNDNLLPFLKLTRSWMGNFIQPRTFEVGYQISLKNNKVQQEYKNQSFFCDLNGPGRRSVNVPTSVHRLTPGDIDVIGAIGDSLTAANGAFAINGIQTTLEGRGVSWSIGGKDNWRKFVTLPNLIKEFNPNLYGYAEAANSLGFQKESKFNVAEPGAISGHTVRQVKNLVKRMRSDRNVDIQRHWKVITVMIGSNDFCLEICYHNNQDKEIEKARADMIRVLRILRENLPRTLVNVVIPVDVGILFEMKLKSSECQGFHWLECPCMVSLTHQKSLQQSLNTIRKWKVMVKDVVDLPEFHNRDDFEVTLVKFTENIDNSNNDGSTDYTNLSKDCFHLSQKGHKRFAIELWNAMLTTENERIRTTRIRDFSEVKCPTQEFPYFRTRRN